MNVCHRNQVRNEKWVSTRALTHFIQRFTQVSLVDLVRDKCTAMQLLARQYLLRAFFDANRFFCSITALAGFKIELPTVKSAHQIVAVNLTEHRQISIAVWAPTLHHVITDGDV